MRRLFAALFAATSLGAPAVAQAQEPAPGTKPEARAAGEAISRFAVDLYGALRDEQGNLFFSPTSLSVALAMTREGAKGADRGKTVALIGEYPLGETKTAAPGTSARGPRRLRTHVVATPLLRRRG